MKKTTLFLMCILFSFESFGFTEKEEAAAYKKLSSCSNDSIKNRINHLGYVKDFAAKDEIPLGRAVETYNQLSCSTYDVAMLKVAESVNTTTADLSKIELLGLALSIHKNMKNFAHFPSGILMDTFGVILEVITKTGAVDGAVETYLEIFSTIDWHRKYSSDIDMEYYYLHSNSPKQAEEALFVYKSIWKI